MKIDPEFKALIPPLQPEERAQLEENLRANGCRDPLVAWRGVLIDGHNRYEICERLKVRYRVVEVALASREHVLLWIAENQLGRRNLTDDVRAVIAHRAKKLRVDLQKKERASKAGKAGGRNHPKQVSLPETSTGKLKDRAKESLASVAKSAKVSEWKLRQVQEIEDKKPEALPQILSGEKTLREVRTEIRREERIEKIAQLAAPPPLLSDQKFPVLYADPPWLYEFAESDSRKIENQYPTMPLADICKLAVPALDDAALFLWATPPKLHEALAVIEEWGFKYRSLIVWVKDKIGMGYWARERAELLLIATRGQIPAPSPFARPDSVVTAPRGAHSEKPREFYEIIDRMFPALPKIELFARGPVPEGWKSWGNQADATAS
jgi:N6-adenosine-specific RNA methylase IME4